MQKKLLGFLALSFVLIGAGVFVIAQTIPSVHSEEKQETSSEEKVAQEKPQGGPPQGGAPQAMPVSVVTIQKSEITISEELPARISAYRQSQVRPQVAGIITERLFEEGTTVKKGDQLYQIDDSRYRAALNSALADLQSAKANSKTAIAREKRYRDLVKINAVSQQEYDDNKAALDQAKAAIAVAQAAVDLARVDLDYTKVYAPISGRISKSFVTEGALVTANQTQHLAVITQLDPVYVDMQQSGKEAMRLRSKMSGKEAAPVKIVLDEVQGTLYSETGSLKFSEVTIDETTGSIALRAVMPNPNSELLPGLFVRARIGLGTDEVLLLPQRATVRQPDGSLAVWVVADGNTAAMKKVEVSRAHKDQWMVKSGLAEGDQVIIEGYQKIGPGAPVLPMPWQQAQK